jgi:hypothetical protein
LSIKKHHQGIQISLYALKQQSIIIIIN